MFNFVSSALKRFKQVSRYRKPMRLKENEGFGYEPMGVEHGRGQFKRLLPSLNEFHTYSLEKGIPKRLISSEVNYVPLEMRVYASREKKLARLLFVGPTGLKGLRSSFADLEGFRKGKHEFRKQRDDLVSVRLAGRKVGELSFVKGMLYDIKVSRANYLLGILKALKR